ncbi:MAG: PIN domain-containing protein [Candidatus Competibacteraceae bacterium]
MREETVTSKRVFVLDTNVLIHDPTALFRFKEHDIHLPMMVLEELDHAKKGLSEMARNVRQVGGRFMDELIAGASKEEIDRGLPLLGATEDAKATQSGRLFFQTRPLTAALPGILPGNNPDNDILAMAMALQQEQPDSPGHAGFQGHQPAH